MCEEAVNDETLDLLSIYRRFKKEYPDFTVFQHETDPKKEGYYVLLVISQEDTPDHNYARLNVADDTTLTVGLGSYVTGRMRPKNTSSRLSATPTHGSTTTCPQTSSWKAARTLRRLTIPKSNLPLSAERH